MADGHAALPRDPGQMNTTIEVFAQKLGRAALQPGCEAACDDFRQANEAAMSSAFSQRAQAAIVAACGDHETFVSSLC
jgi:hypothetical protein